MLAGSSPWPASIQRPGLGGGPASRPPLPGAEANPGGDGRLGPGFRIRRLGEGTRRASGDINSARRTREGARTRGGACRGGEPPLLHPLVRKRKLPRTIGGAPESVQEGVDSLPMSAFPLGWTDYYISARTPHGMFTRNGLLDLLHKCEKVSLFRYMASNRFLISQFLGGE